MVVAKDHQCIGGNIRRMRAAGGIKQEGVVQGMQAGAWLERWSWSSACQAGMGQSVTCLGPVNTQPKGLLSHAYEIGGSTEVLAPIPLRHISQAEACVCLHIFTDPGLRGQETGLRHTPSQLQKDMRMRQGKGDP